MQESVIYQDILQKGEQKGEKIGPTYSQKFIGFFPDSRFFEILAETIN